jgi:hypothetical protein
VLVDRLNTKTMLKRMNLNAQDDTICVMCSLDADEDRDHLLFSCLMAQQCWQKLGIQWDTQQSLYQ